MDASLSRRSLLQILGAAGFLSSASFKSSAAAQPKFSRMPAEGKDTPKICLGYPAADDAGMRRVKQIGVDNVLMGGPRIPWEEADIRGRLERFKAGGLTICNMMISGFNDVIWGRPGADEQTENVIKSIRAAGKAGLPVIEYNFYAHRLMDGYKEETRPGRRRLHRVRLRAVEESPAARRRSAPTRAPTS